MGIRSTRPDTRGGYQSGGEFVFGAVQMADISGLFKANKTLFKNHTC
jgi:hypothetical protein